MHMDIDIDEERDITANVEVKRVDNGYQVECWRKTKEKRTIQTMFGKHETNARKQTLVFSNLADVVKFLGEHYNEPTVGL